MGLFKATVVPRPPRPAGSGRLLTPEWSGPLTYGSSDEVCDRDSCRRPVCRQSFTPGRRGSVQEFCSAACRCAFHAEARQLGQRRLTTRARRTPPGPGDAYWHSGIDAATGRRIPVAVRPAWALAHSAWMSVFDLLTVVDRFRGALVERRRLSFRILPGTANRTACVALGSRLRPAAYVGSIAPGNRSARDTDRSVPGSGRRALRRSPTTRLSRIASR